MRYIAYLEREPTEENPSHTETKRFDHSDAEPITPYAKACELYGKSRIIDIYSEDES